MFAFPSRQGSAALPAILSVVGVLLLIGIIVWFVDPAGQMRMARDIQRKIDVEVIMNAIIGYARDNNGRMPFEASKSPLPICRSGVNLNCGTLINLNALTGAYLRAMPADPKNGTAISTAYTLSRDGDRITVAAPSAENGEVIMVTGMVRKGQ